jgi:hypothetical protein
VLKHQVTALERKLNARRGPKPQNIITRYIFEDVNGKVTSTRDERVRPAVPGQKDFIISVRIIDTPKTLPGQRPIESMTDLEVAEEVQRLQAAKRGKT